MREDEIQALIDASVARALAAKDQEISEAIAFGLRTFADRPVGEKGSPSLQYGVVDSVEDTYAYVLLDGQTDAVPINMLGGLVVGERVAVLLVPPSGNLAIGMVTPSTPTVGIPPGGTAGQVLTKIDGTDFNDDWETPSAGGSGFPVGPTDDTVATHEIAVGTPVLGAMSVASIADDGFSEAFVVTDAGTFANSAGLQIGVSQLSGVGASGLIDLAAGPVDGTGGFNLQAASGLGANPLVIQATAAAVSTLTISGDIFVINPAMLPTSDPGNSGQLYTLAGVLMVSP